jgi:hypothetical protein
VTEIVASSVQFLGGKGPGNCKPGAESGNGDELSTTASADEAVQEVDEDDIPW